MKTIERTVVTLIHRSEVMDLVQTDNPRLGEIIEWADGHPGVWKIVTARRSKAFGIGACTYIGWAQRSMDAAAILERLRHLHELGEGKCPYHDPNSIFVWRARFTLDHYQDKGFTGGFFQQHDAKYPRSCLTLDYTPETFQEVLDRFCAWMDRCYDTHRVTVNDNIVRTFTEQENEHAQTSITKAT